MRRLPLAALALVAAGLPACRTRTCCPPSGGAAPTGAPARVAVAPATRAAAPALDGATAEELIAALRAGNERYRSGAALHPRQDAVGRAAVAEKQAPKVAVLACADSRVAPEVLFDQGLGDLFVVRVAGNVATDEAIASLEYAVEHLGVRAIVVLGHERCGAVKAALAGGELPGHLPQLIAHIKPAVDAVPPDAKDRENDAIAANAASAAHVLAHSGPLLEGALQHHHLSISAAVYDLDTGAVTFLPAPPPAPPGTAPAPAPHAAGH